MAAQWLPSLPAVANRRLLPRSLSYGTDCSPWQGCWSGRSPPGAAVKFAWDFQVPLARRWAGLRIGLDVENESEANLLIVTVATLTIRKDASGVLPLPSPQSPTTHSLTSQGMMMGSLSRATR